MLNKAMIMIMIIILYTLMTKMVIQNITCFLGMFTLHYKATLSVAAI